MYFVLKGELLVYHNPIIGSGMYFVLKGELLVLSGENVELAILVKGQFFGDLSLLTGLRRTASVRTTSFCTLAFLSTKAFAPILQKYPAQMDMMADIFKVGFFRQQDQRHAWVLSDHHGSRHAHARIIWSFCSPSLCVRIIPDVVTTHDLYF